MITTICVFKLISQNVVQSNWSIFHYHFHFLSFWPFAFDDYAFGQRASIMTICQMQLRLYRPFVGCRTARKIGKLWKCQMESQLNSLENVPLQCISNPCYFPAFMWLPFSYYAGKSITMDLKWDLDVVQSGKFRVIWLFSTNSYKFMCNRFL